MYFSEGELGIGLDHDDDLDMFLSDDFDSGGLTSAEAEPPSSSSGPSGLGGKTDKPAGRGTKKQKVAGSAAQGNARVKRKLLKKSPDAPIR